MRRQNDAVRKERGKILKKKKADEADDELGEGDQEELTQAEIDNFVNVAYITEPEMQGKVCTDQVIGKKATMSIPLKYLK